jgi:hypothetical protein
VLAEYHTEYDHRRSPIPDFLILRPTQFNHALSRRMGNFDFSKNCVAIIRENNSAHGIEKHLKHSFGAKA